MKIEELKRELQGLFADRKKILAEGFTEETRKEYDEMVKRSEEISDTLKAHEELVAQEEEARKWEVSSEPVFKPDTKDDEVVEDEKRFGSFGEQLMAVVQASVPGGRRDERLIYEKRAASGASESVPADGGFLVQKDFTSMLLDRIHDTGVLASRCRRIPISGDANGLTINTVDEKTRKDGGRWGGVLSYWANEADTVTAKKVKFREMEMKLHKLFGLCYATDELLKDASALEAVTTMAFEEEMGFKVDDAIFEGDGVGKPQGILDADCTVSVAKESGQSATTLVTENIVKMWSRMIARSRMNGVWFINQDIEPQLFTMSLPVGTGGAPTYMPPGGLSQSPYGTLMGKPVIPIEHCPTLGTVGDIVLADLSQYVVIEKGGLNSEASIHVRFIYDEMCFRFILRIDGQPKWNAPLVPFKGSNSLSPFVTLATRS